MRGTCGPARSRLTAQRTSHRERLRPRENIECLIMSRRIRTASLVALAGIIAGASGIAAYFYHADLKQARDRLLGLSHIAQTPCGPIEYAVAGDGPPVLVVHGAGGGFDQGLEFGAPLAEQGFRVIAMSRFGYLGTPLPENASPTAQADAHACLLASLGLGRVAVIGGSAGAPSSVQFALRHPDKISALVLLVPALYVPRPDNAPSVHEWRAGREYLYALYEAAHKPGKGHIEVFVRARDGGWKPSHQIQLPKRAEFEDYAAMSYRYRKLAVVSQDSARVWVAHIDEKARAVIPGSQAVYRFPSKRYGNVEGIAWLAPDILVAVSDRTKKRQPARFSDKDQSIHLFRVPPA